MEIWPTELSCHPPRNAAISLTRRANHPAMPHWSGVRSRGDSEETDRRPAPSARKSPAFRGCSEEIRAPLPAVAVTTLGKVDPSSKESCMARSSKTATSKARGGIKARGRPATKKTAAPRKKKAAASRKTVSKTAATRKKRTPSKTIPSKSRASAGGSKVRGRAAAKKTVASTRKRTPAKTTASKSRASASGRKARGRTAANITSRATKTASKRASASPKRGTAKSASKRSAAQRTRRTENANLGAAVTNPVTEAMALGTEVVGGAIQAGGEIAAASADMAMSAARTAAAVTTGVIPEGSQEDKTGSKRERERGGGRRGS